MVPNQPQECIRNECPPHTLFRKTQDHVVIHCCMRDKSAKCERATETLAGSIGINPRTHKMELDEQQAQHFQQAITKRLYQRMEHHFADASSVLAPDKRELQVEAQLFGEISGESVHGCGCITNVLTTLLHCAKRILREVCAPCKPRRAQHLACELHYENTKTVHTVNRLRDHVPGYMSS